MRKEAAGEINRSHGKSKSRLYSIYHNMLTRTENPKGSAYECYGGRGITVCPEWRTSFEAFHGWAVANGYQHDLSIDRIDNDLGYSPENCRWTSTNAQFNNRRSNRTLTYNGETMTVAQWACKLSINRRTLYTRLNSGWPVDRALTEPAHGGARHV